MTMSKTQFRSAEQAGFERGCQAGRELAKQDMQLIRQSGLVDIIRAASELAQANAKLTYAMSRITDKLL